MLSPGIASLFSPSRAFTAIAQSKKSTGKASSQRTTSTIAIYKQNCARCHGSNGRGETVVGEISGAPRFTSGKWQESVSDKRMEVSIMHGRGDMPAFEGKLSRKQISSLRAYVRSFKE